MEANGQLGAEKQGPSGLVSARSQVPIRFAIALGCARLRSTRGGRLGFFAAIAITLMYGVMAILVCTDDDPPASLTGLLSSAASWLAWLAAGPVALAAANNRRTVDRRDGIEVLAATRGVPLGALDAVRALSAMIEVARVIALPSAILALLVSLLSGSLVTGALPLVTGAGLVLFAVICGVTLGWIASFSARLAGPRGRSLFLLLIFVPWALADLMGNGIFSIPGALGAFLSFIAGAS